MSYATSYAPTNAQGFEALSESTLRRLVPSAFATEAHSSRSERYTYIPTADVIEGMQAAGLVPTFAKQSKTRIADKAEHTKHMIRFRPADARLEVGGLIPEVCLVNSHDGSSAYQLFSGLFRLVCANGLMTGNNYEAVRIRHSGNPVREVIEGSFSVIEDARRALSASQTMGRIGLDRDERQILAEAAHALRFDGSEIGEAIRPELLLNPRRSTDSGTDLFSTMNVIQENVIRGGLRTWQHGPDGRSVRRVRSRAVEGIDQSTALNRALWTLGERMAELKG